MTRKGRLEEILSRALHADDSTLYTVVYRDFENFIEIPLDEFLKVSENFSTIPATRIYQVKRENQIIYNKRNA